MLSSTRPRFSAAEIADILSSHYELEASTLAELPSERDQNFLATCGDERFVLKIANETDPPETVHFQNEALAHLARSAPHLSVPRIRPSSDGASTVTLSERNLCRVLTYLPGKPIARIRPLSTALLRSIGGFMGELDVALKGFSHDAQSRYLYWDTRHAAETIGDGLDFITDANDLKRVERVLAEFEETLAPRLSELPVGVIHNDGNDYNILTDGETITGLLDFGDMVESCLVFEVANTAAYCMLGESEPLRVAAEIVSGYHEKRALNELELELLLPLIRARLAMSVANCARQAEDEPDEDYLRISAAPVRQLLQTLAAESNRLAHYRFRGACGLTPHPRAGAVHQWLSKQRARVLPFELTPESVHVLDLSMQSTELGGLDVLEDVQRFSRHISETLREAKALVGIGRYDEPRPLYTSPAFQPGPGESFETRTLHLGIDLFVEADTPIRAPLDGKIHSFQSNDQPLDYGPTIIVEHQTDDEDPEPFWTLYGHLSASSLEGLSEGAAVHKGQVIGTVGNYPVNGNWPPHLHFQIILDLLDRRGDFPGVCRPTDRKLWLSLCPDPTGLAGSPVPARAPEPRSHDTICRSRRSHLSSTLSLSYPEPLHIVRGFGSFLYDEAGRAYLDMVNNVCHVGHCHPKVVRAAQRQIAVLNTNTRYLHENIVDYAERLCATLPKGLDVCFFVNSGSEANDLALRLARTKTGRDDTLVLEGAYHGNLSSLIEVSPYKFDGKGGRGAPAHVHKLSMPDGYRGQFRASDPDYGAHYLDEARRTLSSMAEDGRPVGALMAESIMSCGGQIVFPPGYLKDLFELVRDQGGVCIADEVQVGFGRAGSSFWAFAAEEARPDIVTMGKPIGNGHPLAAVVTTREVAQAFATGMEYFNTFGGNPVSCAVGLAVLDVIEKEGLQENAERIGAVLRQGLEELQSRHALIGEVRGRGLFLGLELVHDRETLEPAAKLASDLVHNLKNEGILASTDGPLENVIKLKPPLVLSRASAERFIERLDHVLSFDRFKT